MGRTATKATDNVYYKARMKAAQFDGRFLSREKAAEMLGLHPSTLADYELSNTKVTPVDKVVLMADIYKEPYLKYHYCKHCCPIGADREIAEEIKDIQDVTVNLIASLNKHNIGELTNTLVAIAADRVIDDSELPDFGRIVKSLREVQKIISEICLLYETTGGGENGTNQ